MTTSGRDRAQAPCQTAEDETIVLKDRASHLKKGAYVRFRSVDGRAELTHKGPKQMQGKDKWRFEHTLALGDGPALELLQKMGFRANTRYVKDTAIFLYRTVLVSVDRIGETGGEAGGDEETVAYS